MDGVKNERSYTFFQFDGTIILLKLFFFNFQFNRFNRYIAVEILYRFYLVFCFGKIEDLTCTDCIGEYGWKIMNNLKHFT